MRALSDYGPLRSALKSKMWALKRFVDDVTRLYSKHLVSVVLHWSAVRA